MTVGRAMTEALGDGRDDATPELERLYRRWSGGGAGLLISGHLMVDRRAHRHARRSMASSCTEVSVVIWSAPA